MPTSTFYYSNGSSTTSSDTIIAQSSYNRTLVLTSVNIGNGVTSIGNGAFDTRENLIGVSIPNSVTSIGDFGFGYCNSIKNITVPDSVNAIGESAFIECVSLSRISIPKGVNNINFETFYGCSSLIRIDFLGNAPTLGIDVFFATNANLKVYRKKNFVTGWSSTFGGKPVVLISDNVVKSGGSGKLIGKKRYLYIATGTGLTPNINGLGFYDSGLIYNGKKSFYSEDYQYAIWYWGGFPTVIWLIGSIANIGTFNTNSWGKVGATDTVAGSYIGAGDKVGTVIIS
jgi:hypothetical protein